MNYILYYIGVYILGFIAALIVDLKELHSFKKQLKEYNLLYPINNVGINDLPKYETERGTDEENALQNSHFQKEIHHALNQHTYGEATERKNDDD